MIAVVCSAQCTNRDAICLCYAINRYQVIWVDRKITDGTLIALIALRKLYSEEGETLFSNGNSAKHKTDNSTNINRLYFKNIEIAESAGDRLKAEGRKGRKICRYSASIGVSQMLPEKH